MPIVLCQVFPSAESKKRPSAKIKKVNQLYAGEFAITPTDGAAYAVAGLSFATKFYLGATHELDYNELWFAVPPGAPYGQSPKLGLLHPILMRRVSAAAKAISKR